MEEGGYIESICCLLMGIIFIQTGKLDRAKEYIARCRPLLEEAKPKYFVSMLYGALAYIACVEKDKETARKYGMMYLEIASSGNFIQMGVSLFSMFSKVFENLPRQKMTLTQIDFIDELTERCARVSFVSKIFNIEKHTTQSNYTMLHKLYEKGLKSPWIANLFGVAALTLNGREINLKGIISKKAKQLLLFMLHRGRKVSKDEVIDILWPRMSSKNIDDLFHATPVQPEKRTQKGG